MCSLVGTVVAARCMWVVCSRGVVGILGGVDMGVIVKGCLVQSYGLGRVWVCMVWVAMVV